MVLHKVRFLRAALFLLANGLAAASLTADAPPGLPAPPPLPPELKRSTPKPPPDLPDPSELTAQLKQLGDLLALSPEKLSKLRDTITFIENMSPGEREAMRIRISQITESTPELKEEIAGMTRRFPEINRKDLSQFWHAASEEERASVREGLEALPAEQQLEFLETKVDAFRIRRDEVFQTMRRSLPKRRPPPGKPVPEAP